MILLPKRCKVLERSRVSASANLKDAAAVTAAVFGEQQQQRRKRHNSTILL